MLITHDRVPMRAPVLEALRVNSIVGRARLGLSQEGLAERAGVSRPTISRIERGAIDNVGLDTVQRIADALGVHASELLVLETHDRADDEELARRSQAPDDEFVDADTLFAAINEAGEPLERYSRAGRPRVAR
jgi:transcriptional regulator with XRE-family HTH domain